MTIATGTDSVNLDLTHITPDIGVTVVVILTEAILGHFIGLHTIAPCITGAPAHTTHMAYFLTDDSTLKGKDQNINIIDGIRKIKGKTSVNILVSNYTNKHLTFHKGEYIRHLKPAVLDSTDQQETHQTNSVTLKKMMLHLTPLIHQAMNSLQPCRITLNKYRIPSSLPLTHFHGNPMEMEYH